MRLIPRSLHMRLLTVSAAATLLALLVGGWAIGGVLERFVVGGLDRRLDSEIAFLASAVDGSGRVDRVLLGQRRGVVDPGPGWRWRIAGPDGIVGSADFPALAPRRPPPAPPAPAAAAADPAASDARLRPLEGEGDRGEPVHARTLTLPTTRGPVTLTASAPRDVVRRPIRAAVAPLLAALALLAAMLGAATVVQLRVGLRPVRRLRDQVVALRSGERDRIDQDQISELRPLALELDALAQDNARALAAARRSAANLAHALKTPVATLALGVRGQADNEAQVDRIDAILRHHLGRARAQAIDRRSSTPLAPVIAEVIDAVRRIHGDRTLAAAIDKDADLVVAIDRHDLQEMIGNLLDNAAAHARRQVRVAASRDPADRRRIVVAISDDGPGIAEAERGRILLPGVRLDERGDGHGFGLAIVSELAGLYGGSLTLGESPEGGLAATLSLPSALAGRAG